MTYYAEYLEEDLGVAVNVNNKGVPGDTTEGLLLALRSFDELRDAISQAEVITIWIGLNDMWSVVLNPYLTSRCGNAENLDLDCVREKTAEMEANIDAILGEIISLRGTNDTLIRIADNCPVLVYVWKDAGAFEELKGPGFEDWSQAVVQAAAKYGIPVVHSHVALNGPDGDQPIPEEYLLDDGVHFNAEGYKFVADLHREVGYEYGGP